MERFVIVMPVDTSAYLLPCDDGDTCKLETLQKLVGGPIEMADTCLAASWAREDVDSIQFLPRLRGLARKPLVLLRDDGRNEKAAVESLSQEDACYLIRQATLEDMLQELRARHIKVPEQVKLASFYDLSLIHI